MRKFWRVLTASAALLALYSASVLAVVEVEAQIQDIQEAGVCDPYADTIAGLGNCGVMEVTLPIQDPTETTVTCSAGPDGAMGTGDDVCTNSPKWLSNPNGEVWNGTVTSFRFNNSTHEVVGTLRFSASVGELTGGIPAAGRATICDLVSGVSLTDDGDWDIPDRLFDCADLADPLNFDGCAGGDGGTNRCGYAPDLTGRLDSKSCSDFYNPADFTANPTAPTHACSLNPNDPNTTPAGQLPGRPGFTFFNYMACFPTFDCFDHDPTSNTSCDMGGAGPFDTWPSTALSDVWISGTVMAMRLPFGIRLGNTLYPGIMLNGTNQFSADNFDRSARMVPVNPAANDYILDGFGADAAWPAVVFDFEANHELVVDPPSTDVCGPPTSQGPCCTVQEGGFGPLCKARFGTFDKILIFVPDILTRATDDQGNQLSSFSIGEDVFNEGGLIPTSRLLVSNPYKDDVGCGIGVPDPIDNHSDYDTTICIDIRGSVPVLKHDAVINFARHVAFDLELPNASFTDFTDQQPVVAVLTPRGAEDLPPLMSATPISYPNCDGYNFCFIDSITGDEYPGLDVLDPNYLWVPSSYVGEITLTEPSGGFIRVDSAAGTTTLSCYLPTSDSNGKNTASAVDFVYVDDDPLTTIYPGTDDERIDCGVVYGPQTAPLGTTTVSISPASSTMDAIISELDYDRITIAFLEESNSASTVHLSGYELLVEDDPLVFPGGIGCIELNCTLYFPGDECKNHEGTLTNGDASGDIHFPEGGGSFTFTNLKVTCIVPGRTVLLYPYLVKALGFDTGVVVTNTAASEAIVHFYLFEEEGRTNIATNPVIPKLAAADPERLVRGIDVEYLDYNEIPRFGQYVNLIFEVEGDPNTGKPKNSLVPAECGGTSSGIFPYGVLEGLKSNPDCNDLTDDGRVWMYVVVQQCYSHGYQMVFSEGGFGSTLALVDQDTVLFPVDENLNLKPRGPDGKTQGTRFIPIHHAPSRFINPGAGLPDMEVRRYQFWNGNDE